MGFSFKTPPHILFERGSASQLGKLVGDRMKRPVFVTDQGVIAAGLVGGALESLREAGLEVFVYDKVVADPPAATQIPARPTPSGRLSPASFGVSWVRRPLPI